MALGDEELLVEKDEEGLDELVEELLVEILDDGELEGE